MTDKLLVVASKPQKAAYIMDRRGRRSASNSSDLFRVSRDTGTHDDVAQIADAALSESTLGQL
jgi:hypothetical protein